MNTILLWFFGTTIFFQSAPNAGSSLGLGQAINISGKQRMLTQRMGKAYMLKYLKVESDKADKEISLSVILFEENLRLLKEFSPTPEVNTDLDKVQRQWDSYKPLILGTVGKEEAIKVLTANTDILLACQEVVLEIQKYINAHPVASKDPNLTSSKVGNIINLSGRQRSLCQRICLYYAAFVAELPKDQTLEPLKKAYSEFENAFTILLSFSGNNQEIDDALGTALQLWTELRNDYDKLFSKDITVAEMYELTTKMMTQMDKVTSLYEKLAE